MYKNSILLLMAFTTLALHAQRKPKIKGNRTVIEVKQSLPAFNKIEVRDELDISLKRTTSEGYSITADDNLIDVLKFRVEDSTLVISSFYQITAKKKLEIEIGYTQLRSILLSEGRIETKDKINTDMLSITSLGSSKIDLSADVGTLEISMEANSSGIFNITADSLSISMENRADASVYSNAFRNQLQMSGKSSLTWEGTADDLSASMMGDASLKAENLEVQVVNTSMEASSEALFFVLNTITLSQKGTSRCYLYGEPKIEVQLFTDAAELLKRKQ